MDSRSSLTDFVRDRIVSALYMGHLHAGDRLPSIREVSGETGKDHRAVARAYRALEAEGLVRIVPRSGIYVAEQERLGGELLAETARWMGEGMMQGGMMGMMGLMAIQAIVLLGLAGIFIYLVVDVTTQPEYG